VYRAPHEARSRRVVAFEGVNLTEYRVAIAELKNVLDSMTRARDYIRTVLSKRS
jgi:hypothetical protein